MRIFCASRDMCFVEGEGEKKYHLLMMFPRSFRSDQQEMNQNSLFKNSNIAEEMTFK